MVVSRKDSRNRERSVLNPHEEAGDETESHPNDLRAGRPAAFIFSASDNREREREKKEEEQYEQGARIQKRERHEMKRKDEKGVQRV